VTNVIVAGVDDDGSAALADTITSPVSSSVTAALASPVAGKKPSTCGAGVDVRDVLPARRRQLHTGADRVDVGVDDDAAGRDREQRAVLERRARRVQQRASDDLDGRAAGDDASGRRGDGERTVGGRGYERDVDGAGDAAVARLDDDVRDARRKRRAQRERQSPRQRRALQPRRLRVDVVADEFAGPRRRTRHREHRAVDDNVALRVEHRADGERRRRRPIGGQRRRHRGHGRRRRRPGDEGDDDGADGAAAHRRHAHRRLARHRRRAQRERRVTGDERKLQAGGRARVDAEQGSARARDGDEVAVGDDVALRVAHRADVERRRGATVGAQRRRRRRHERDCDRAGARSGHERELRAAARVARDRRRGERHETERRRRLQRHLRAPERRRDLHTVDRRRGVVDEHSSGDRDRDQRAVGDDRAERVAHDAEVDRRARGAVGDERRRRTTGMVPVAGRGSMRTTRPPTGPPVATKSR
jgi:hypothetical protein